MLKLDFHKFWTKRWVLNCKDVLEATINLPVTFPRFESFPLHAHLSALITFFVVHTRISKYILTAYRKHLSYFSISFSKNWKINEAIHFIMKHIWWTRFPGIFSTPPPIGFIWKVIKKLKILFYFWSEDFLRRLSCFSVGRKSWIDTPEMRRHLSIFFYWDLFCRPKSTHCNTH